MKITIERALLLKSLSHVQSVVERRQTIPILSNVLLDATVENGGTLLLRATDNEIEISDKVPATVEQPAALTVSAHKLYDIVKKLPDGAEVRLECEGEGAQLQVSSGRSRFALATIPAEGFPTMAVEEASSTFSLPAKVLADLIERTQFAASTEETHYNLNGLYLHEKTADKSFLKVAATDGHRLATAQIDMPEGVSNMPAVIIPRKTIGELTKLLAETQDEVLVCVSQNQVRFSLENVILSSRLIDGNYPDYERVIPEGNDKFLEVDSSALITLVDRVAVIFEKSKGIKLQLKKGVLTVTASNTEEGMAEDEMEAGYDGEPLEVGFNYRYLLDILSQVKGGTVRFSLKDAQAPVILQDANDASALYVLMPMRV
ncbi:MAG: DNA polymerase III subunit beta [Alphaproteobacteria bacterium]|nr:DNA polymerase III subunit beta [Alphaproteobacteria bacterium]